MIDVNEIKKRADELEEIKVKLKEIFVGLDDIIDEFINNIKVWYILPDVQTRPLIVNLWGMTGIGKTDLVRKFVKFAGFNDRFIEIQMDIDKSNYYYGNTIQSHIDNVLDNADETGILLLDEMQRFRTIDENQKELHNSKYSDLWMLLSDGKFESDSKNRQELSQMIFEILYDMDSEENGKEGEEDVVAPKKTDTVSKPKVKKERKYKMWTHNAKRLKKILKTDESIETIMTWSQEEKLENIKKALTDKNTFEGNVFSKLLIIISGNIDEAYSMSDEVNNADTNADLFYEFSKKVNVLTIKKCLSYKFKPEQIARFGNSHIIYPSLSKHSYKEIIKKKIENICKLIDEKHELKISVHNSVFDIIYRNGVFPTQGVRPVLSTISSIFENSLPHFIYHALLNDAQKIDIHCLDNKLVSSINNQLVECEIPTMLESLKKQKTNNEDALVAVHEAGHAVAYALLFKVAPTQIICKTASDDSGGFISKHDISLTRQKIKDMIAVNLAGRVAEEIVFGKNFTSTGAMSDIKNATNLASNYVRKITFSKKNSSFVTTDNSDSVAAYSHDVSSTNILINDLMDKLFKRTYNILKKNIPFLKKVIEKLYEKKELSPGEFVEIAKEFVSEIQEIHAKELFIDEYENKMFNFLKK
jgi:cell division protease FtsH